MFQLKISVANNHWWTQGIDSWSPTSLLVVTVVVDFIENYKSYSLDLKQLRWKRNNQTCQKENEMHKNLLNIKHKTTETQEGLKNTKHLFSNLHCGFYIRAEGRSFKNPGSLLGTVQSTPITIGIISVWTLYMEWIRLARSIWRQ